MATKYNVYRRGRKRTVSGKVRQVKNGVSALVIRFRGGMSRSVKAFNKANKVIRLRQLRKDEPVYVVSFKRMSIAALARLGQLYHDSGFAEYAEPYVLHAIGKNAFTDPKYPEQWILENTGQNGGTPGEDISVVEALDLITASGIVPDLNICVAVLDDGVDIDHPDLQRPAPGLWHNNFSVFNGSPKPKKFDHHGTGITGLIAATQNNGTGLAGINPFCKIMAGRLYYTDPQPNANPIQMADGIRRAVDGGARVINLSWRQDPNAKITDAITYGHNHNVVFCVAAGNFGQGESHAVKFPGNLDDVITVGACNNKSEWIDLNNCPPGRKFGSCYGREVDIVAPGAYLVTTENGGGYTSQFRGTSGATAIVSAIAGLVLAVNPQLTNVQVRDILLSTADPIGTDPQKTGHGKVNALRAVEAAIESRVV